ncbi:MAG: phosphatidylinositol mannoside acyltransferase [Anaerolineales bacterium]
MSPESRLQAFTNSRYGVNFALYLGRSTPPALGYRIANLLGSLFALQRNSRLAQAVRRNQAMVSPDLHGKALDARVRAVFVHAAECMYDLYRNLNDEVHLAELFIANEARQRLISGSRAQQQGALVVAPHMSNFDGLLLALSIQGMRGQVLSYAAPTSGYDIQNRLRARFGLKITPVNPQNIRQAIENMRQGGYVYTAVDRPDPRYLDRPLPFFGQPAALPAGYITLALEAGVPILPVCAHGLGGGKYEIWMDEPVFMETRATRQETLRHNAMRVLQHFEAFIRRAPEQWMMYYPVWPETSANAR